ncbi:MAG: Xaa-Pro peptidase family protein [Acidobacteriota bacterium]|nr:Xaa-Pro peptidase family protein [Acidobacteriota bacterium]
MANPAIDEFTQRRAALGQALGHAVDHGLAEVKLDALFVASTANVRYLTGFTGSNGALLVEPDEATFLTDPRYRIQAGQQVSCKVLVAAGPLVRRVVGLIKRKRIRRLGIERNRIGFEQYDFLKSELPLGAAIEPVSGAVERMRMVKSDSEIALIRASVETNSRAFEAAVKAIRPGMREFELAAEIDYLMRRLGAEGQAFDTIVAGGLRTALPHAHPGHDAIQANQLMLIDMGAMQNGYASDMTRMLHVGKAGGRVKEMYRAVLEAQRAALAAVRPGVSAASVDRAARNVLKQAGLDKTFIHSTGHGLGLEIHEPPRVGKKEKTRLEKGMAITIEPGAYVEGVGGIRIEDTVLVTATGCEILTPTPKELLKI